LDKCGHGRRRATCVPMSSVAWEILWVSTSSSCSGAKCCLLAHSVAGSQRTGWALLASRRGCMMTWGS
jgi:hypothetical protein